MLELIVLTAAPLIVGIVGFLFARMYSSSTAPSTTNTKEIMYVSTPAPDPAPKAEEETFENPPTVKGPKNLVDVRRMLREVDQLNAEADNIYRTIEDLKLSQIGIVAAAIARTDYGYGGSSSYRGECRKNHIGEILDDDLKVVVIDALEKKRARCIREKKVIEDTLSGFIVGDLQ